MGCRSEGGGGGRGDYQWETGFASEISEAFLEVEIDSDLFLSLRATEKNMTLRFL